MKAFFLLSLLFILSSCGAQINALNADAFCDQDKDPASFALREDESKRKIEEVSSLPDLPKLEILRYVATKDLILAGQEVRISTSGTLNAGTERAGGVYCASGFSAGFLPTGSFEQELPQGVKDENNKIGSFRNTIGFGIPVDESESFVSVSSEVSSEDIGQTVAEFFTSRSYSLKVFNDTRKKQREFYYIHAQSADGTERIRITLRENKDK